ncbi:hypothetical protein [Candidatus Nitronereus thalassa]|uniref:Succinylglutamate desuccinylase n=1 Tax=Candidatus Nitronereus thalassa TaxID=3020898 RepID=A0ABU3KCI4_9BACT|nr:hypothetical protein [Candidatus Nitronereus thalassa]MDT7044018.1 hypothetical protein [Candidatus Nitronereus thalassa]
MKHQSEVLRIWEHPRPEEVGDSVEEFLRLLGGPTWIEIPGKDQSRSRAIVTLLHGNEPSGVHAIHQWLRLGNQPQVNVACFLGAIDAALAPPGFALRTLPGHKDLNRCWKAPFDGTEGRMAQEVLDQLRLMKPEALIDLHNTSGRSPSYAITTQTGNKQKTLTSLFSDQLVITDLRLGALMEAIEFEIPTIAVECGEYHDPQSHQLAFDGINRFAQTDDLFSNEIENSNITVFEHPVRIELQKGRIVAYGTSPITTADLTLRADADKLNFDMLYFGEQIGWAGPDELNVLTAFDAKGNNRVKEIFSINKGQLHLAQAGRILMMTTDPIMASTDCLFYFLPATNR